MSYAGFRISITQVVERCRDHGWSYDRQVRSDVFGHADVTCFYLTINKTAYIYITKAFDQSEPRNNFRAERSKHSGAANA